MNPPYPRLHERPGRMNGVCIPDVKLSALPTRDAHDLMEAIVFGHVNRACRTCQNAVIEVSDDLERMVKNVIVYCKGRETRVFADAPPLTSSSLSDSDTPLAGVKRRTEERCPDEWSVKMEDPYEDPYGERTYRLKPEHMTIEPEPEPEKPYTSFGDW